FPVRSMAASPDGKWFVVGTEHDGYVRQYSLRGAQPGTYTIAHRGAVQGLAVSPDGRYVATAGSDKTITVLDTQVTQPGTTQWQAVTRTDVGVDALCVGFSPSGDTLYLGTAGDLRAYPFAAGRVTPVTRWTVRNLYMVMSLAPSPDGRFVAFSQWAKSAHAVDAARGTRVAEVTGLDDQPDGVSWVDGTRVATGTEGGTLYVWDVSLGAGAKPVQVARHDSRLTALAALGPSTVVYAATWAGPLRFIDVRNPSVQWAIPSHMDENVKAIVVSKAAATAVTGGDHGSVILWDVVTAPTRPAGTSAPTTGPR
ncbi:MAG TPA: hypothetical protein VF796_19095, partial [Humisphaera sp.]